MNTSFKAGIAKIDISPPKGVSLGGYPHHPRYNTGIHDPLYAACMYLEAGDTRLAIVTMDLLTFSKRHVKTCRERISRETGIPGHHISICCSHSHSSPRGSEPFTMDAFEMDQGSDAAYIDSVNDRIVDLVVDAAGAPFEATIGIERGFCGREHGVGGNRRTPEGIADPEVWVIGVRDTNGNWRGILAKYALHPTFLHSDNFQVSADYPGYIRSYLAEVFPDAVFLFTQGTSGNQSPRYFRSGKTFAEAERVGTTIGKEIVNIVSEMNPSTRAELSVNWKESDIELRDLPDLETAKQNTEEARMAWESLKSSGAPEPDVWNAELRFLGAEDTQSLAMLRESGKLTVIDNDLPAEVQVIGIGDARIVLLPGETFVEFGITIQYRAPFEKCFVVELANGVLPGYAATRSAYAVGGYETGASLLTGASGEQLVDTAVTLLIDSQRKTSE